MLVINYLKNPFFISAPLVHTKKGHSYTTRKDKTAKQKNFNLVNVKVLPLKNFS